MLNGMLWIIRSGAQWCELLKRSEPAGVPCWKTGPMVPGRFGNISQPPGPGTSYAIPPQSNVSDPWPVDWLLYKERHLVECFFQKIKWFLRTVTKYDTSDASLLSFMHLASIAILLL